MLEKDLEIYDIWESPNGNLFIKVTDNYSIAIGTKGYHEPFKEDSEYGYNDLDRTQYVKANNITPVKKVGRLVFD